MCTGGGWGSELTEHRGQVEVTQRLAFAGKKYEQHRDKLRELRDAAELEGCTFEPQLCAASTELARGFYGAGEEEET